MHLPLLQRKDLLIYSTNDTILFDPFDLDVDVTPHSTVEALREKQFLNALVMAFRLNEEYLINKVYEAIPIKEIPLVASNIPAIYLPRILKFIGDFAIESQHIEFNLIWIKALLSASGGYINEHKYLFSTAMRSIQRFIVRVAKEVVNTTTDNKYTYRFLVSTDGSMEDGAADDDEVLLKDDADEDNEENEENDVAMESDDEEGWIGFNGKDNKLPLSNENDFSDEEEDEKELP